MQASELVRRVEDLLLDGLSIAGPHMHGGMPAEAAFALDARQVQRVVAVLLEGAEIAEQLELLASRLPDGPIDASYEAVRAAAAADLAAGIVDPRRLLLAARLLDVPHGWAALAESLGGSDVCSTWDGLVVETLLCSFRGADRARVHEVAREAGLEPGAQIATCPSDRLLALAAELRRASGQPA